MGLRDLVVTPFVLFIVYVVAFLIRPKVTNKDTKRYFIPALTVKIIGASAIGFIYQFYYHGGDTFAFHTHGSRVIWEAFIDNPLDGLSLFFSDGNYSGSAFKYAMRIWYYDDPQSFIIIQIATILDLLTFSSYSATAILFSLLSFSGVWALYLTFYKLFRHLSFYLALSILFVPSVFFWGSGILKDTLTLGCLGWMIYCFNELIINRKRSIVLLGVFILSAVLMYAVKVYIILSLVPALLIWFTAKYFTTIKRTVFKILLVPIFFSISVFVGYVLVRKVGEDNPKYALENLAKTAQITAYDIRYGWGARLGEGSGYTLGELDGSFESVIRLAPNAINVSLFRPYLWEVRNPLMLLSALEALFCLLLTLWVFYKVPFPNLFKAFFSPEVLFCLVFALVFAFAVGISTFNFGTLARYKIPLLPFYLTGMILIYNYGTSKRERKFSLLDSTE
ncbi:MAG: hypothetical protein AAF901_00130 [Bacteroidota bacterium]